MKEILSVAQMRNAENQVFASGVSELELMQKAVDGIFPHILSDKKTIIVCGFGNNGGDGLGLALKMAKNNADVSILLLSSSLKECGKFYLEQCKKLLVPIYCDAEQVDFSEYEQIVDCIFGIGFHGKLEKLAKKVVKRINLSGKYIVSVDIPSGVNGNNGCCDFGVKSNVTVAVGALKYGNLLNDAKDFASSTVVCDIGISKDTNTFLFEDVDAQGILEQRKRNSHKGNYGYVAIIGGSLKYCGAIKLSNLSLTSLKCGAGVSKIIVPDVIAPSVIPFLTVSTLDTLPSENGVAKFDENVLNYALNKINTVCIGMGMTDNIEVQKILQHILMNFSVNLIIDADGLNALSKINLCILNKTKCKVVLTPHILEFSRLSGLSKEEIIANPVDIVADFAKKYNVILLLKGATTIVSDGNITYFVDKGTAGMATAGSGDVLSGVLCGLLGYNEYSLKNVALGAYINGKAGEMASEKYGEISMTSYNTIEFLPQVIKTLVK